MMGSPFTHQNGDEHTTESLERINVSVIKHYMQISLLLISVPGSLSGFTANMFCSQEVDRAIIFPL